MNKSIGSNRAPGLFPRKIVNAEKTMATAKLTPSTQAALNHLRRVHPTGGWSVESLSAGKGGGVRLLRRNIPLTDHAFLDLHVDPRRENAVLGMLGRDQGQILVNGQGQLVGSLSPDKKITLVPVTNYPLPSNHTRSTTTSQSPNTDAVSTTLSDEQNRQLMQLAGMIIVGLIVVRMLMSVAVGLSVVILPLFYLYMIQTCPRPESFDAKRELKRVLRGHYLPEDHPEKPKGWFQETVARVTATVATEVATGLSGYTVTMYPLGGAAHWTVVVVPSARLQAYWIGAFHTWYYIMARELPEDDKID